MFLPGEDSESRNLRDSGCMMLAEKMLMWTKNLEEDLVFENDTHFEGVEDEVDDLTEVTKLPLYNNRILKSAAYEWFIVTLKKESALQWTATYPRVMIEDIRRKILNQLSTQITGKRRAPDTHSVTFGLVWQDTMGKQLLCKVEKPTGSEKTSSENIIITGSREEAQALTVQQYFRQTWPANWQRLLEVLRKAIDSSGYSSGMNISRIGFVRRRAHA